MVHATKLPAYLLPGLLFLHACSWPQASSEATDEANAQAPSLTMMSTFADTSAATERNLLLDFTARHGMMLNYIPSFEATEGRLEIYQNLFRRRSPLPDILEVDVIWPTLLANDLVDLKPYFGAELSAFPPELLKPFLVANRLVGLPITFETGLLYYRSDLLKRYGFRHPPQTWDELETMAAVIQNGERRAGKRNFWGYVWQGLAAEALTCNALEWQASHGGGQIIADDRTVDVNNPNSLRALQRAVSWIGTISPPGVIAYDEDDSMNVWKSGNAAFMRHWAYTYGALRQPSTALRNVVGVALLPLGAGNGRVLGGFGISVSNYSPHREEAVAALRYLVSAESELRRIRSDGTLPTRLSLQQNSALMQNTPFHGTLAGQAMTGVLSRPSVPASMFYPRISRVYFEGIHAALTRQTTPEQALTDIQNQLVKITGFPPTRRLTH